MILAFALSYLMVIHFSDAARIDPCQLPLDPGSCFGHFDAWGFGSSNGKCEKFVYGGCGGNANRFPSEEECKKTCGGSGT
ncbi:unnamed protein product [Rodentolepis nana]|uniref:BPTI/Kunitz inhibitor domain-containing protein n=1 Tax=Rodentolepis nana TaxID=102285 RepID=A0A0R3TX35_RODNA|nr:unnamed protein product [Rodentolepis nana]